MNILTEQFERLKESAALGYDKAVNAVSSSIKASPLIAMILSGCAVDAQTQTTQEQSVSPEVNQDLVYMALSASEGAAKVSTPVVSFEVLRVVIQEKNNPENTVIAVSGGSLGNSLKTYLPEPLSEGNVAILKAFVDSSCADDSIESCTQKVVMVNNPSDECDAVRESGNVCASGNDEAPIPYAW